MGFGKFLKRIASVALPIAASFIPGVGPLASAALTAGAGALGTKISGGSWGDALKAGALSGLGSFAAPYIKSAIGGLTQGASGLIDDVGNAIGLGGLAQGSAAGNAATSVAPAVKSMVNYGTPFGPSQLPWQNIPTTSSGGVLSSIANAIPSGSDILGKLSDNALPLALGAVTLLGSGGTDPNAESQRLLAEQQAKDAEQSALWNGILNSNDVNRTQTDTSGIDWNNYGSTGTRKFFTDINPTKTYAQGGMIERDSDSRINKEAAMRLRARMDNHPMVDSIDHIVGRYMDSNYPGTIEEYVADEYGDSPVTRAITSGRKMARGGKVIGKIKGKAKGQDDTVPILGSAGEFVVPADVVSHLGDGNTDAGAEILKGMMAEVRKHKTGNTKLPPKMKKA